jgi:hypothetical protein
VAKRKLKRNFVAIAGLGSTILLATFFTSPQLLGRGVGDTAHGCGGVVAPETEVLSTSTDQVLANGGATHQTGFEKATRSRFCADERGMSASGVSAWNRADTEADCHWDSDINHGPGPGHSIRLQPKRAFGRADGFASVRYVAANITPGSRYSVSAWVLSQNTNVKPLLFIAPVQEPNNRALGASTAKISTRSAQWQHVVIEGIAERPTLTIGLAAQWNGPAEGALWLDDITVRTIIPDLVCDSQTDNTSVIQTAIDQASAGSIMLIPKTDRSFCKITASLKINKPIRLFGEGPDSVSMIRRTDKTPLSATHVQGAVLSVTSDDIHIKGLHLIGEEYGNVQTRNTHGVWVIGTESKRIKNVTIESCTLEGFRGRAISLVHVDDFIVKNNRIRRSGYAGIIAESVRRGRIQGNHVSNINDPEICALSENLKDCQYANGYPIALSGCGNEVCSEDVIIDENIVRENELWVGIMNHGGHRVLILDNEVSDTNFLYANTVSEGVNPDTSHDTWFVDNTGDIRPQAMGGRYDLPKGHPVVPAKGDGIWLAGPAAHPTSGLRVIGNRLRNTGNGDAQSGLWAHSLSDAIITWNHFESDAGILPPQNSIRFFEGHTHAQAIVAHNTLESRLYGLRISGSNTQGLTISHNKLKSGNWGAWLETPGSMDIHDNDFKAATMGATSGQWTPHSSSPSQPAPPSWSKASPGSMAGTLQLQWSYPTSQQEAHDSFYVEYRPADSSEWTRLAYRPANHSMFRYEAPSNPRWTRFDPLSYLVHGLPQGQSYEFRIRAHHSNLFSNWSQTIAAEPM